LKGPRKKLNPKNPGLIIESINCFIVNNSWFQRRNRAQNYSWKTF